MSTDAQTQATAWNVAAEVMGYVAPEDNGDAEGLPCVQVAGVQVYAYVKLDEDGQLRLVVSVDCDSADRALLDRREAVPLDVNINGSRVWTSQGRQIPTLVSPQVQYVAAQVVDALATLEEKRAKASKGNGSAGAVDDATTTVAELAGGLADMVLDPRDTTGFGCHCTDNLPALAQVIGATRNDDGAMQKIEDFLLAVDECVSDWRFTANVALRLDEMIQRLAQDDEERYGHERPGTFLRRLAQLDELSPKGDLARKHFGSMAAIAERARGLVDVYEPFAD